MADIEMDNNDLQSRRQRYFQLNSQIAQIDDQQLAAIFASQDPSSGWGQNHVLEIAGRRVFVKRVPLTDFEYANAYSTKNLYDIPTYYNYGVGSAGFGAFRELVANIKTTNWVLAGETERFPLLFSHRILSRSPSSDPIDMENHQRYIEYWGGDDGINRYILDRAKAHHELVLFLEYIPHVLHSWLQKNADKTLQVVDQLQESVGFLFDKGIIHFDGHYHNILTDGEQIYLTDFGLVLDKSFPLSDEELAFFQAHRRYDHGQVLSCLCFFIDHAYDKLDEEGKSRVQARCEFDATTDGAERVTRLLENIIALQQPDLLPLAPEYVEAAVKYRKVIAPMRRFYFEIRNNLKKDTPFPSAELESALVESGFCKPDAG